MVLHASAAHKPQYLISLLYLVARNSNLLDPQFASYVHLDNIAIDRRFAKHSVGIFVVDLC